MVLDYEKATDEEVSTEMIAEYKIEKLATIEMMKKQDFNDAKETEMKKLRVKNDEKVIAFGKDCQTAEDADYDTSKIPDGDSY